MANNNSDVMSNATLSDAMDAVRQLQTSLEQMKANDDQAFLVICAFIIFCEYLLPTLAAGARN
jgi:hypothetical protein